MLNYNGGLYFKKCMQDAGIVEPLGQVIEAES